MVHRLLEAFYEASSAHFDFKQIAARIIGVTCRKFIAGVQSKFPDTLRTLPIPPFPRRGYRATFRARAVARPGDDEPGGVAV